MATSEGSNNSDVHFAISLHPTLISLPSCDLKSLSSGLADSRSMSKCQNVNNDPVLPPLLLVQLPVTDLQQLIHCKSYFLGQSSNDGSSSGSGSTARACLVMEASSTAEGGERLLPETAKTGKTFFLNRVETSNSLILIPSFTKSTTTACSSQEHINKKMKGDHRNEQLVVGRLVNPSSFLELKRKPLNMQQLYDLLYQDCISRQKRKKRNYGLLMRLKESDGNGYTIAELASLLQSSAAEVKEGLAKLCSFEIHSQEEGNSIRYTFLSDETVQEYMRLIFAVLIEYPELVVISQGIQTVTVHRRVCCTQVLTLVTQEDSLTCDEFDITDIIQYCLSLICTSPASNSVDHPIMTLDKDKVAIHLAHDIFQQKKQNVENYAKRTSRATAASLPFEEGTNRDQYRWTLQKFQEEWCRQMPFSSVEGKYPSAELLKGIALQEVQGSTTATKTSTSDVDDDDHEDPTAIILSYFPERNLPLDIEQRLSKIFAFREEWTLQDLEPYIQRFVTEGSRTQAELLLRYTRVITKDDGTIVYRIRK